MASEETKFVEVARVKIPFAKLLFSQVSRLSPTERVPHGPCYLVLLFLKYIVSHPAEGKIPIERVRRGRRIRVIHPRLPHLQETYSGVSNVVFFVQFCLLSSVGFLTVCRLILDKM